MSDWHAALSIALHLESGGGLRGGGLGGGWLQAEALGFFQLISTAGSIEG